MPTDAIPGAALVTDWLAAGGTGADIAALTADIRAIVELADHAQAIGGALAATADDVPLDDPGRLAAWLIAHAGDELVAQAFAGLGLTGLHDELLERRARLGDAATLLQPLGGFAEGPEGRLTLSLPAFDAARDLAMGPAALRFDVGATGGLSCSAAAAWPFAADAVSGRLVRIGGQGAVTTMAGLSLPFGQVGSGTAHAEAAGALSLGLFFRPAGPDRSYAGALLDVVAVLPSPLSLAGMDAAAGWQGLVLSGEGSVSAGIDVTLGKSIDIPGAVSGKLGLSAGLSFARKAQWLLSLRRVDEGLRFVLSRDERREQNWSAGVDLALDAAPLARRIHDLLRETCDVAGPALSRIRPFLSPGTYLKTEAASLLATAAGSIVEQPAVREALLKDASLALGITPPDDGARSSALATLVASTIADLAASHAHRLLDDATQWAGAITADLVARVPPLAAVASTDIEARLRPLLGDVIDQFDGLVGILTVDPTWAKLLGDELAGIGAVVRTEETEADALLAGARTTLERFFDFADRVIAATADDTRAKLAARFGWSGAGSSGSKYDLIGTFTAVNEATAALWQALVTGRLAPFQAILADPAAAPAGLTLAPESSLSRFAGGQRGFAAEIALFGIDASLASIVKGEATVIRNAAGDIAVTAKGSALRQVEGFGEGRIATFVSSLDLLALKADGYAASRRAMAVDLGFDHADKDLTVGEVRAMLAGLADQGLIEAARVDTALARYQDWRVKGAADGKVRGRIGLRLRLPPATAETMIAIGRRLNAQDNTALISVFDLAVRSQIATGVASQKAYDRDLKTAMENFTINQRTDQPVAYLVALSNSKVDLSTDGHGTGRDLPALAQMLPRAAALAMLLRTMAQIHDAVPITGNTPPAGAWSAKDYADAERRMVSASRSWLRLNQNFVFFFKAALHPALLAFLRLLVVIGEASAAGNAIDGFATPIDTARSNPLFVITMSEGDDGTPTVI